MSPSARSWLKFRIRFILFIFLVLFIIILARLFQLQVIEAQAFKDIARKQQNKSIPLPPERGTIYDRNQKEIAVSLEVMSLYAHPSKITDTKRASYKLSKVLKIKQGEILYNLSSGKPFVWIKRKLSNEEVKDIKDLDIDGLGLMKESKRIYTEPFVAPHLIGFVGVDSQGLEGIEFYYDPYIRGEKGYRHSYRDALGREISFEGIYRGDPSKGLDIILTIDRNIQHIAQMALKEAVSTYDAKGGFIIVMDPYTGEILAMANEPSFNPNNIVDISPEVWRNRAITDLFEPGSTFKVFLAAAALEEGKVKPGSLFYGERGLYNVSGRLIHDYKKFGWLSLEQIIKYSSNIGAIKVGEKLGREKFYDYMDRFGFGSKTGVALPGEASGILKKGKDFSKVALATMSFGQGVSVTGIQLITALSSVANGGYVLRPFVVKKIVSEDGKIIKEFTPQIKRRVISEETSKTITSILKEATEGDGTGVKAAVNGYSVAGKTGTAQKVDIKNAGYLEDKYISSFIGYVPADEPKLVMLVVIDEPTGNPYGGLVAAPVFKKAMERILPYMRIPPVRDDIPKRYTTENGKLGGTGDVFEQFRPKLVSQMKHGSGYDDLYKGEEGREESDDIMPSFLGKSLREVLKGAWGLSLEVDIVGTGIAVSQSPEPGMPLKYGDKMKVYFEDGIEKNMRMGDNETNKIF